MIQDTQQLYRELEDFNKQVNSDDKSRYEPPIPPAGTPLNSSNAVGAKEAIVPRHYQRTARNASVGVSASAEGDSKLANIRRNWEEHNLKVSWSLTNWLGLNKTEAINQCFRHCFT